MIHYIYLLLTVHKSKKLHHFLLNIFKIFVKHFPIIVAIWKNKKILDIGIREHHADILLHSTLFILEKT